MRHRKNSMQVTAHIRASNWQRLSGVFQIDLEARDALALGGPSFDLSKMRLARYQRLVSRLSDERLLGIGSQAPEMVALGNAVRTTLQRSIRGVANGSRSLRDARH